jgi:hypothetical protein
MPGAVALTVDRAAPIDYRARQTYAQADLPNG